MPDAHNVPQHPHTPSSPASPLPIRYKLLTRSSRFVKWKDCEVGHVLEGTWLGTRPSANPGFGPSGVVQLADGTEVLFGLPVTLAKALDRVPPRTAVRIQYDGMTKGKNATYHSFTVGVDERVDVPDRPDGPPRADDSDVPF